MAIADGTLVVPVRESARVSAARLVAGAGRSVEAVVPAGMSDASVERLLREHRDWLARQVARLARRDLGLARRGCAWVDGRHVPIERSVTVRSTRLEANRLLVPRDADAERAVAAWYRAHARRRIDAALAAQAPRVGAAPRAVRIGDPRTRWGSCSPLGTLSFSWRLVLAPPATLEYVVLHELCHRIELNHSPAFWALVETTCPGWREHARWLRSHGPELLAYSPGRG